MQGALWLYTICVSIRISTCDLLQEQMNILLPHMERVSFSMKGKRHATLLTEIIFESWSLIAYFKMFSIFKWHQVKQELIETKLSFWVRLSGQDSKLNSWLTQHPMPALLFLCFLCLFAQRRKKMTNVFSSSLSRSLKSDSQESMKQFMIQEHGHFGQQSIMSAKPW